MISFKSLLINQLNKLLFLFFAFVSTTGFGQTTPNNITLPKDTLVVLSELRFKVGNKLSKDNIPEIFKGKVSFKAFLKDFELMLNLKKQGVKEAYPLVTKLLDKESYYERETKGIEVRIKIPNLTRDSFLIGETYDIYGAYISKKREVYLELKDPIKLYIPESSDKNYINNLTFKLTDTITISSPEEVSITVFLNYLNRVLSDPSEAGYAKTLKEIETIELKSFVSKELTVSKLLEYYSLLHFLEPFVEENSFFNEEARKLNQKINAKQIPIDDDLDIINPDSLGSGNLAFSKEVYNRYLEEYPRLENLYEKLKLILFFKTPSQLKEKTSLKFPDYKGIQWLHQSDVIIGKEIIRLGVKEVHHDEKLKYHFELSVNDTTKSTFQILSDDFTEGEYLTKLFLAKVKNSYNEFRSPNINHADTSKILKMVAGLEKATTISSDTKIELEKTLKKATSQPRLKINQIQELLQPLLSKVNTDKDSVWLKNEIKIAKAVIENQETLTQENLKNAANAFLTKVFKLLLERKIKGPSVGMLYAKNKIQMWTDEKDSNVCKHNESNSKKSKPQPQHLQTDFFTKDDKSFHLNVNKVDIVFENGQIGEIKVVGKNEANNSPILFQSRVPISYSNKADVSADYYGNKGSRTKIWSPNVSYDGCYVFLDEVIYNDYKSNNFSQNYSPVDTSMSLKPFEPGRILHKKKVTDLFQARVFTDILGYGNENPNGLVQMEIAKKIFIRTKVKQIEKFFFARTGGYIYRSAFNYVIPSISVTKTEKDDKFLPAPTLSLRSDSLNTDTPPDVKTMDLLKYSNFFSGNELNLLLWGFPKIHSVFHLNVRGDFVLSGMDAGTEVQDTASNVFLSFSNEINVASIVFSPLIVRWDLNPHPNYRVYFSYHLTTLQAIDSRIKQVETGAGRWYHQISFSTAVKFNKDSNGEFFFRSRLSMNLEDKDENFFQSQIGYSFKIFSGKPETKSKKIFYDVF